MTCLYRSFLDSVDGKICQVATSNTSALTRRPFKDKKMVTRKFARVDDFMRKLTKDVVEGFRKILL